MGDERSTRRPRAKTRGPVATGRTVCYVRVRRDDWTGSGPRPLPKCFREAFALLIPPQKDEQGKPSFAHAYVVPDDGDGPDRFDWYRVNLSGRTIHDVYCILTRNHVKEPYVAWGAGKVQEGTGGGAAHVVSAKRAAVKRAAVRETRHARDLATTLAKVFGVGADGALAVDPAALMRDLDALAFRAGGLSVSTVDDWRDLLASWILGQQTVAMERDDAELYDRMERAAERLNALMAHATYSPKRDKVKPEKREPVNFVGATRKPGCVGVPVNREMVEAFRARPRLLGTVSGGSLPKPEDRPAQAGFVGSAWHTLPVAYRETVARSALEALYGR